MKPWQSGVRYIVQDVQAAVDFYRDRLGFKVEMEHAPDFAAVKLGHLVLYLNAVAGSGGASQAMPDGTMPQPGGWNRIRIEVDKLELFVSQLREQRVTFRNDLVVGQGGRQILLEDPSGNLIELFQSN